MEQFLKNLLELSSCVIRDITVSIDDRTLFRIDLSGSADADGIKRKMLLSKATDSI